MIYTGMPETVVSIDDVINSLKKSNESKRVTIPLVCSDFEVVLEPLGAKQISKINSSFMASGMNGSHHIQFTVVVKSIFDDLLTLPEGKTYNDINIVDMHFLVFKLREMLGNDFKVLSDVGEEEVDVCTKTQIKRLLDSEIKTTHTVKVDGIEITLELPSYKKSFFYNKELKTVYDRVLKEKVPNMEVVAKEAFVFMLLPFLKDITIINNKETQTLVFEGQSIDSQRKLLNTLSKECYRGVLDSIEILSEPINVALTLDGTDVKIPFDHTLFIDR